MATSDPIQSHRKTIRGSDRNFGLVFAGVFTLVGALPLLHGGAPRWWALIVATAFCAVALGAPKLLGPLNLVWYRFGLLLHHIVNPIVMGVMFYGAFTPMGLIIRAAGKDLLRLKRDPQAQSYWIDREPPAPKPGSMAKQF